MTLAPSIPGDDFRSQVKEMRVSTTHGGLTLRTAARGHWGRGGGVRGEVREACIFHNIIKMFPFSSSSLNVYFFSTLFLFLLSFFWLFLPLLKRKTHLFSLAGMCACVGASGTPVTQRPQGQRYFSERQGRRGVEYANETMCNSRRRAVWSLNVDGQVERKKEKKNRKKINERK